jgi:hypothetical protein
MELNPVNALQIRCMRKPAGRLLIAATVASERTDILGHRDARRHRRGGLLTYLYV